MVTEVAVSGNGRWKLFSYTKGEVFYQTVERVRGGGRRKECEGQSEISE